MASEWLSSGFGLPASYSGTENSDGGTGLTLCTQFTPVKAGWITKLRFWKTSIDTATSRTVGIFDCETGLSVTSEVTSGEPVGTAQWVEVTLSSPIVTTDTTLFDRNYYAAVAYDQQKYPATAGQFSSTGYYSTPAAAMFSPATADSDDGGGIGNGAFRYGTSGLVYPDGSFGGGYYWVDVLWTDVDPSPGTVDAFQPEAFQADTFQTTVIASFNLLEGADVASFNVTSTTLATFNILEGPDVAHFDVTARTYVSFNILEGPDVAHFNVTSTTLATFNIHEGPDVPYFEALTGAQFSFDLTEGPDVAHFRTWAGDFTLGDADYIVVPYELRASAVPQEVTEINIRPEDVKSNLQDEWQRIDVDQTRGRRDT